MAWHLDRDLTATNGCCAAVAVVDGAPALSLMPHPRDACEALWFHVLLRRLEADASAPWLQIANPETLFGGGDGSALQPAVRCDAGEWRRLPRAQTTTLRDGRGVARWRLPAAAASIEIAFCVPYAMAELDRLVGETGLRAQAIGASEHGRPLTRLDNGPGLAGSTRPGLFVIARQHSGETPGSWVLDGLLRRIAELGDAAPLTWAIPLADIDGVAEGRYGKDGHPVDINRAWPGDDSLPRRHEVLCYCQDFARWRARCAPRLVLDLHAPGGCERRGVYAFTPRGGAGEVAPEIRAWAERLRVGLGGAYASGEFARIAGYAARWPRQTHSTFGAWVANQQHLPQVTVETSYQGRLESAFSIGDYRAIGRLLADAIAAGAAAPAPALV